MKDRKFDNAVSPSRDTGDVSVLHSHFRLCQIGGLGNVTALCLYIEPHKKMCVCMCVCVCACACACVCVRVCVCVCVCVL